MNYFKNSRRCLDISDYKMYLNKIVGDGSYKERLNTREKLAKVLLFNLEHYVRYEEQERLTYTLYILDHYTTLVADENDAFRRPTLAFKIPKDVRKKLFDDYKEYLSAIDYVMTNSDSISEMIEKKEYVVFEDDTAPDGKRIIVGDGIDHDVSEIEDELGGENE